MRKKLIRLSDAEYKALYERHKEFYLDVYRDVPIGETVGRLAQKKGKHKGK